MPHVKNNSVTSMVLLQGVDSCIHSGMCLAIYTVGTQHSFNRDPITFHATLLGCDNQILNERGVLYDECRICRPICELRVPILAFNHPTKFIALKDELYSIPFPSSDLEEYKFSVLALALFCASFLHRRFAHRKYIHLKACRRLPASISGDVPI